MAIQPIDLQTIFSQLDKVGKTQADQKEGVAIQQSLQTLVDAQRLQERIQSVNETQDPDQGAEKVKDRQGKKNTGQGPSGKREESGEDETPQASEIEVVRDPNLGKNIDVSG